MTETSKEAELAKKKQHWTEMIENFDKIHTSDEKQTLILLGKFEATLKHALKLLKQCLEMDPSPRAKQYQITAMLTYQIAHGIYGQIEGKIQEQQAKFHRMQVVCNYSPFETPSHLTPEKDPDDFQDEKNKIQELLDSVNENVKLAEEHMVEPGDPDFSQTMPNTNTSIN